MVPATNNIEIFSTKNRLRLKKPYEISSVSKPLTIKLSPVRHISSATKFEIPLQQWNLPEQEEQYIKAKPNDFF